MLFLGLFAVYVNVYVHAYIFLLKGFTFIENISPKEIACFSCGVWQPWLSVDCAVMLIFNSSYVTYIITS